MVLTTILEVVISLIIEITIDTRVMEAIKRWIGLQTSPIITLPIIIPNRPIRVNLILKNTINTQIIQAKVKVMGPLRTLTSRVWTPQPIMILWSIKSLQLLPQQPKLGNQIPFKCQLTFNPCKYIIIKPMKKTNRHNSNEQICFV
jgi:energy-converting hydrogenase Eha subunit A